MRKIVINERELRKSIRQHLLEQSQVDAKDNREEKNEPIENIKVK